MASIDYRAVFDSVDTAAALGALRGQVSCTKLWEGTFRGRTGRVISRKSGKFLLGTRRGNSWSPKLFASSLEGACRKLDGWDLGTMGEYLSQWRLVGDIVLRSWLA